ncbi:MAG: tripartite tricarboxylate transporter permease, partial [Intestinibacillus sp.]
IAKITLLFGPPEYFSIAIFGLSIIASVSGGNVAKGLIGGCLGIFVSIIGMDSVSGVVRYSFGNRQLSGGIPLIVTLVGLFALAELLSKSTYNPATDPARKSKIVIDRERLTWPDIKRCIRAMFTSSIIGTIVGATPGTGGGIAAFISYDQAKKMSKVGDNFGKGEIEGIAASESANNATTGSTMIPLLTLGIPGDGVTAILLGALMLQGMVPGPSLFVNSADIIYAIMIGLLVINVLMLVIGRVFTRFYVNITRIPYELMSAMIIVYCIAGTYSAASSTFHVLVAVCVGVISYVLRKLDFPIVPIILGVVLGQLTELNFRRSLVMSDGSFSIFVTRPFSLLFVALAVFSIVWAIVKSAKNPEGGKAPAETEV